MKALLFDDTRQELRLLTDYPKPVAGDREALIKVLRAGICSTDLEITRGYVPGFHNVLGHEFVGVVEECSVRSDLVGQRVVGEINCNIGNFTCADAIFTRNHAPGRSVLGIIGKDGCMAQYITLPVSNLHVVPDELSDEEACYAEPLAAACRITEQGLVKSGSRVAVIGDGKLGLLVAQVLVVQYGGECEITLFGRHANKMALVQGVQGVQVVESGLDESLAGQFDLCVEASGSSLGIELALKITRPLGTLVLKSTTSLKDPNMPGWSRIANDIVVNEKVLVGSRCGPIDQSLDMMVRHKPVRRLLHAMTSRVMPLVKGVQAMEVAATKGVIKVQLLCCEEEEESRDCLTNGHNV